MSRASGGLDLAVPLDAVFRRNASARPQTIALADPPDRALFTDGMPRRMSYVGADAAVLRLAQQLVGLGLQPGTVVAIQLPNIVEAAIALLAVERAGLVAAPLPLAWRKADLVPALKLVEAAAIITVARAGDERPAVAACEAAAHVLSVSFLLGFGDDLPEGVIRLDIDHDQERFPLPVPAAQDKMALLTFDADRDGSLVVGRSHAEWIAAGLGTVIEAQLTASAILVSTLPLSSLAGIGGALVPWLLTGGTLQLLHGFSPDALERAIPEQAARVCLLAPARALAPLIAACAAAFASVIAVQRGPAWPVDLPGFEGGLVDLHVFGEVGAIARRRKERAEPEPIPLGRVSSAGGAAMPVGVETRIEPDGTMALSGAMVPHFPWSAAGERALTIGGDGFVRTGFACHAANAFGLVIQAGPEGVVMIGGLRFGLEDLKARLGAIASDATLIYLSDAVLGGRVLIEAEDAAATGSALEAAGFAQVVLDAIIPRQVMRRLAG